MYLKTPATNGAHVYPSCNDVNYKTGTSSLQVFHWHTRGTTLHRILKDKDSLCASCGESFVSVYIAKYVKSYLMNQFEMEEEDVLNCEYLWNLANTVIQGPEGIRRENARIQRCVITWPSSYEAWPILSVSLEMPMLQLASDIL